MYIRVSFQFCLPGACLMSLNAAQALDFTRLAKDFLDDTQEKHISTSLSAVRF